MITGRILDHRIKNLGIPGLNSSEIRQSMVCTVKGNFSSIFYYVLVLVTLVKYDYSETIQ